MVKLSKAMIFALFLALLVAMSGCSGKKDPKEALENIRTGTQGIAIGFMPFNPPDIVHVEQDTDNAFNVILELHNFGAYPQFDEKSGGPEGRVFLSGFDKNIIDFKAKETTDDLGKRALEGKSIINLQGGEDIAAFEGAIKPQNLNVEKYDLTLLATACYEYETQASQTVCIDPDPYSTINERKVCQVQDVILSSQGAPIAVTSIEEEAFARKTQFRITIKNVGGGDVFVNEGQDFEKCNPFGTSRLEKEDFDKVNIESVKVSDVALKCRPFVKEPITGIKGIVRLANGEGSIICELQKSEYNNYEISKTPFTTPITIHLRYNYRTTAEKKMQIKKEVTDFNQGALGNPR